MTDFRASSPMVSNSSPVSFENLPNATKTQLLSKWGCLRGMVTTSDDHRPITSPLKIAYLRGAPKNTTDDNLPSILPEDRSSERATITTCSEQTSYFLRRGFKSNCLSKFAAAPWVPAISHDKSGWARGVGSLAHSTVTHSYKRLCLQIGIEDLEVGDDFSRAVREALEKPNSQAQIDSLRAVFKRWGHVLPTVVELGGSFTLTQSAMCSSKDEVLNQEQFLESALTSQQWTAIQTSPKGMPNSTIIATTRGGDNQALDHASWVKSLESSDHWKIIKILSVVPTFFLLSDEVITRVQALYTRPDLAPVYCFPSRFTSYQDENKGFLETPLPISTSRSFTVSVWIRRASDARDRFFACFALQSTTFQYPLLWFGMAPNCRDIRGLFRRTLEDRIWVKGTTPITVEKGWTHLLVEYCVKEGERTMTSYIDSRRDSWHNFEEPMISRDDVSLLLCRCRWNGEIVEPWDGQLQNLKVFPGILSKAQRLAEANRSNMPDS